MQQHVRKSVNFQHLGVLIDGFWISTKAVAHWLLLVLNKQLNLLSQQILFLSIQKHVYLLHDPRIANVQWNQLDFIQRHNPSIAFESLNFLTIEHIFLGFSEFH